MFCMSFREVCEIEFSTVKRFEKNKIIVKNASPGHCGGIGSGDW